MVRTAVKTLRKTHLPVLHVVPGDTKRDTQNVSGSGPGHRHVPSPWVPVPLELSKGWQGCVKDSEWRMAKPPLLELTPVPTHIAEGSTPSEMWSKGTLHKHKVYVLKFIKMTWKLRKAYGWKKGRMEHTEDWVLKNETTAHKRFKPGLPHIFPDCFGLAPSLSVSSSFLASSAQYSLSSFNKKDILMWLQREEMQSQPQNDVFDRKKQKLHRSDKITSSVSSPNLKPDSLLTTCAMSTHRQLPSLPISVGMGPVRLYCYRSWTGPLTKITLHPAKATSSPKWSVISWGQPFPSPRTAANRTLNHPLSPLLYP